MSGDPGRDLEPGGSSAAPARWRQVLARNSGPIYALWGAGWIVAFALRQPEIAIPMMFGTGALAAFIEPGRRGRRRDRGRGGWYSSGGYRWYGREGAGIPPDGPDPRHDDVVPAPIPEHRPAPTAPTAPPAPPTPERRLAATVVRAESSGSAIDPDALALIREVATLLRPMLADLRSRDADPGVRHDVEAIATEHLPATLDAYLALPADYAHQHRSADGTTPADEFRSQLTLLVEGCTQLRDALRAEDVSRQQQLGRFLQSKFAKSDLDLP